jgi:hypothetical protein
MTYRVEVNYCRCHPETCCCNDWRIVDSKGDKVSTHFLKEDADRLADLLNSAAKERA